MSDNVRVTREDSTTTITLARPEKRNALSAAMMTDLTAALAEAGASDTLAVVIAADGPVFSAGHNFGDLARADLRAARELFLLCTTMMDTVQGIPQPVIAKVHALATAAGCQLVASCDLAIAADMGAMRRAIMARKPVTTVRPARSIATRPQPDMIAG